jgi:hypothetical protein
MKETLEQAGDRELSYINDVFSNNINFVSGFRIGMLLGAKWQQEKTIEEVFEWLTTNNYLTDLKETLIENFKKKH